MSVIAFRPRHPHTLTTSRNVVEHPAIHGTFRSPSGRLGWMTGSLRVGRLVLVPRGAFVTGVFTGELRDDDGTLVGLESRRATAAADLVQDTEGFRPWVRPFTLDLMGIPVDVAAFSVDPGPAFPRLDPRTRRPPSVKRASAIGPMS